MTGQGMAVVNLPAMTPAQDPGALSRASAKRNHRPAAAVTSSAKPGRAPERAPGSPAARLSPLVPTAPYIEDRELAVGVLRSCTTS